MSIKNNQTEECASELHSIRIHNAKTHNLKNISCSIPHNTLCCLTGVSGSGKSSLAFDTIFIEGQRRYIQSLSSQAKRIIGSLPKPDVESIEGLTPTIAIEQKRTGSSPRSTVGTITEIEDYLRLLFARLSVPHCPKSGNPLVSMSRATIFDTILSRYNSQTLILLAPHVRRKRGALVEDLAALERKGFSRVRLDGAVARIETLIDIDPSTTHTLDVVVDRLSIKEDSRQRLIESATTALEIGKGVLIVLNPETENEELFSEHAYSVDADTSYPALEPADFSSNTYAGMCSTCQGLGVYKEKTCSSCKGVRIKPYPAAARFRGRVWHEVTSQTVDQASTFFKTLQLGPAETFAQEAVEQIRSRLGFLVSVGLGYLSLNRASETLSGGESQRVRLASQVGTSLVGITYVLDEPSIGLHPVDNQRLINSLQELRDRGNTVIVVEHDEQMIRAADWILDFGPEAGGKGGELLHEGRVTDLETKNTLTSNYLFGRTPTPGSRNRPKSKKHLSLQGVSFRNLSHLNVDIPLERFVAVTGVSGSGKSTLLFDVLLPALTEDGPPHLTTLDGTEHIDTVLCIDQSPIGRTPRSNPATYTGVFDDIRMLYASLPESKAHGWTASQYSFNTAAGVCPTCSGVGQTPINMDFLETAWVTCATCQGRRYDQSTLSIRYKGASILDVLMMPCDTAAEHFSAIPSIKTKLDTLCAVGLGYIRLGQSATTLSGGEAQRLKIAKELGRRSIKKTLYLLDEPTTGLHTHDVSLLLNVLHELVHRGHTVLVIEHHMSVIRSADWVIDLGPGAGEQGGQIVATGTPHDLSKLDSPTGAALRAINPVPPPPRPPIATSTTLSIRKASQHNLQGLSLDLPTQQLISLVGPSGSGKRSLAFHTLHAESQRQFVESLSSYERQYIRQQGRPRVDAIEGLPPSVAVTKRTSSANPRSTVGTMTVIYDYLRVLWSCCGIPHCPKTGKVITNMSSERVADIVLSWQQASPLEVFAPIKGSSPATLSHDIQTYQRLGYRRARLNGTSIDLFDELPPIKPGRRLTLEVIVDRLTPTTDDRCRLISSIDEAARLGNGQLIVGTHPFHLTHTVDETGEPYPEIVAQTFAFNTPTGWCPDCYGLGLISDAPCPSCHGSRLHPLARHVTIHDRSIVDICTMPMLEARQWFLKNRPSSGEKPIVRLFDEIDNRLSLIETLGIGYLSMNRAAYSLSGGEAQRARLTSQIGSNLSGLLYILDEPTAGLHPSDTLRLLTVLNELKERGNTLIAIDHDPVLINEADHVVELGPQGGICGGELIFHGSREQFFSTPNTTSSSLCDPVSLQKRTPARTKPISVRNATCHNLTDFSCSLPTQALVGIIGVSGSGKSTLLFDVIEKDPRRTVLGKEAFDRIVSIDQTPVGRTARSDIMTFSDLSIHIRGLFSTLPQAQALGLDPSYFSPFTKKGMCKRCKGLGYRTIDMHFLPSTQITCESCGGHRLNPSSLSVAFKGLNLGQILQLSIAEIRPLFEDHWKIASILDTLISIGGSYLRLGQEIASLSAGEMQRVKLARELAGSRRGPTLYLMDEPTTGLHPNEVRVVLSHVKQLIEKGHTVYVVEHNLDFIAACDFLLELGPRAGKEGGLVVAQGTPWQIAHDPNSPTGRFLRERIE